ncbi:MAG: hypothetical protein OEM38_09265 [Gammaproteobacteria bacterium]|nr:hypothetical protein [Gammaproteobacteria bacterium]
MKARMKTNLIARYQTCDAIKGELHAVWKMWGWLEYVKTKIFLQSIDGKIVDLVFTAGDAFEKNDNNIWLPDELWEAI